ncbi:MAG TPA: Ig-like domain-containing protein [Opitutaceae bacterium]
MIRAPFSRLARSRRVSLIFILAQATALVATSLAPVNAAGIENRAATIDAHPIVSSSPMMFDVESGFGAHGQLAVSKQILSRDGGDELVFEITEEPSNGRVGISGEGESQDFFKNKKSKQGYFAYQPNADFNGQDSFGYTVRDETTGLVFQNRVLLNVKAAAPVELPKFEVEATREHAMTVRPVTLSTHPNKPVTQKVPNHLDFMTPTDRAAVTNSKIRYALNEKVRAQNGTAKLDPVSGELTYAPNPGFIGEDHFKYYTVDENNPELGVENSVSIEVQPTRIAKEVTADRSRSREVDLLFVINNSPSMAAHQTELAANLSRFRQLFRTRDLDYRIGVLTTDFININPDLPIGEQHFYKEVRANELNPAGRPILDRRGRPKTFIKHVASNGRLVTLPTMPQPWVTPQTQDPVFSELVEVGTNGDSNRTAFTAVYNFVAGYYNKENTFLRPDATTIVVFFMDEEETRMALWRDQKDGPPKAEWIENGKLPDLLKEYNKENPQTPQTLDGYIKYWVLRPFIIAKGNMRGKLEVDAVVSPNNISHRRAAELTGGVVLNIEKDFSAPLAALGDRIADTVTVALPPVQPGATLDKKTFRVLVDGQEIPADPQNGYVYDELTHSIRFQGAAKKKAFAAKIDVTYDEIM